MQGKRAILGRKELLRTNPSPLAKQRKEPAVRGLFIQVDIVDGQRRALQAVVNAQVPT